MAEVINLRTVRKRAKRRRDDLQASTNRLVHGQPKHLLQRNVTERAKADRDLDLHRIEKGNGHD